MAATRSFLVYLMLALAVVGTFWLADKLAPPEEAREAKPPGQIDYYARNIRRHTSDLQGRRRNILDAEKLARQAGTVRAVNSVILGAASAFLMVPEADMRGYVEQFFGRKGRDIVDKNLAAFDMGRVVAK